MRVAVRIYFSASAWRKGTEGDGPSEAVKVGLLYYLVAIHKLTQVVLAPLIHTCNAPRLWGLSDRLWPLYTYN